MHFLASLLPFLALTSAYRPLGRSHSRRVAAPSLTSEHELDSRGLLDGLLGGGASSSSSKAASSSATSKSTVAVSATAVVSASATATATATVSVAATATANVGLIGGLLGSQSTSSSSAASATTTANSGLLGGLLGSTSTSSAASSSSTDLVTGLLSGVGSVVDATVTTVGGVVEDVADLNLQVLANTCVRLGAAADLGVLGSADVAGLGVGSGTDVMLAAGACICVDAAASVGLNSGVSAAVSVLASGGLYFNGSTAENIAASVSRARPRFLYSKQS